MLELGNELAQEGSRIGNDGKIGRIIAAKLGGVDIDVNEFGNGKIPGISRQPR